MIADDPSQWRKPTAFEPTDAQRRLVRHLAALGVEDEDIAKRFGIDVSTIRAAFSVEFAEAESIDPSDNPHAHFTSAVEALTAEAQSTGVIARIFWMKARPGWVDRAKREGGA